MIAGMQKCGTTALTSFLDQHPQLSMAKPKEPHIFDSPNYSPDWTTSEIDKRYARFFKHCDEEGQAMRGEATPIYTLFPDIAAALGDYNPSLKIIILLRDPVARAVSHHAMEVRRGNENLPLWQALLMEPSRLSRCKEPRAANSAMRRHSYRSRGLYSRQIQNLYGIFQHEQILLLRSEDLRKSHQATLQRVFSFLGVDDQLQIDPQIVFASERRTQYRVVPWLLHLTYTFERIRLRRLLDDRGGKRGAGQCAQ